ncbi:hypothetical protein DO97_13405 [Neosynechococcus sphagnicola sy1]|uniref:Uncharacterized protein n=1 Tax=Neosynechococcus sphagnicola sy1 TaxID=1497020 RepID=A0A098TIZ7_9CYAN|nr:hypothetical protein DO97_13405 [Neosynechococcus sphagnicola sy1]
MFEKRRWLINIALVLSVLGFVGFSMIPLLSSTFQASQSASSPSAAATAPTSRKADLEAQERGYTLVLQREPDNLTALQGLLETRLRLLNEFKQGDPKDLIDPLEKLAKLRPEQTSYAVLLAQTKAYLGDREGAAQTYRDVLQAKPGDLYALNGLVDLLMRQNRPEAAIGLLQDTLKAASQANQVQPNGINVVSVQVLLGEVYTKLERYGEAIATFDQAMKADPQDFRPVFGKARTLKDQGKVTEATQLFNTAFNLAPANYKDQIRAQISLLSTPASVTPDPIIGPSTTPVPQTPPSSSP